MNGREKILSEIKQMTKLDDVNELETVIAKAINERREELNVIEQAVKLSSGTFSFIKESFDNFLPVLFESKAGKNIIRRYVKEHKTNSELRKMYCVYENILAANKSVDSKALLDDIFSLAGTVNEEKLNRGLDAISKLFVEAYVTIGAGAKDLVVEDSREELNHHIMYMLENKKKLGNATLFSICESEIRRFIESNEGRAVVFENKNLKSLDKLFLGEMVREFNEKYSTKNLTESEISTIKDYVSQGDGKECFEAYKRECLETIEEAIASTTDQEESDKLEEIKNKVSSKLYNESTFGVDISNFDSLTKTIKE